LTATGWVSSLGSVRLLLPLVIAVACLYGASLTPPLVAYGLIIAAFALFFDAGTAWLAKAGGTGGLKDFKQ
jgi:hypothetical protein